MNAPQRLQKSWEPNPILVKELRVRMRGGRAFAVLTGSLALLGAFSAGLYFFVVNTAQYNPIGLSSQVGQILFAGLTFLLLVIILAITPALTANAISGEKEKLTYEMLLTTPLHPARVLWGKLISALSYLFLVLFAAIPMYSVVFVFGGVALRDILKGMMVLSASAIMFGVVGLFISSLFGRSGRATAITYLVVLIIVLAPLIVNLSISMIRQAPSPRWILIPSPVSALSSAISPSLDPQTFMSRFWMLSGPWGTFGGAPISLQSIPRPIYHYTLALYGGLALTLYLITTRLVLPARRWQISWTDVILVIILLIGYLGLLTISYISTTNRYENVIIISSAPWDVLDSAQADDNFDTEFSIRNSRYQSYKLPNIGLRHFSKSEEDFQSSGLLQSEAATDKILTWTKFTHC